MIFNNNIGIIILLLNTIYSPWTFSKANPNEIPNNTMKKHVAAAVTISGLAYGKILRINAIIFKKSQFVSNFKS